MNKNLYILCITLILTIISGCTPNTIYRWGHYENFIYKRYLKPGELPVNQEIEQLSEQLDKTEARGERVPPGLHAYLGYLFISTGDTENALMHLNYEKKLFPESTHFIDGLIKRITRK